MLKTVLFLAAALLPIAAVGQTSPAPSPSASPSPAAGAFDASKLTPQQQAALQAAIVKLSQNPVGNIAVVPFQNNFNYGVGPYTRYQYNLNVQPVTPFMLSKSWNLVARAIIPFIDNPSFATPQSCAAYGCGSTVGIGDVQEQLYFAPKTKPGALIWGAGPIFQFPTGTPATLTAGKWAAGPGVAALIMPGHIVTGMLVTQIWSFAGDPKRPNVSSGLFQPFFNYNLSDGWALSTAPIVTVNWVAAQNKWAVPLGGGVAKTFKSGDQIMQLSALFYTYVARPITTPQTNLRVVWSLLYPIKRGIDVQELIKENQ